MPTLALIDGNSIAYRAFFALPEDLATKSGQVTNAVFGFTRMLIRLLKDHDPDAIAVAWDVSRTTFRTERYPQYKAQRTKAPDHFRSQLPLIDEVLQALQIGQLRLEGFEADDIIATLAAEGTAGGWDVLIVTGDRDAFQLVDDDVKVLYTRRGISDTILADAIYVESKYGVTPSQYLEFAALRGDNSDNLPGVPGVGEKTAARLIGDHGHLEGIYDAIAEMTPKLRENLAASREQVFLNRELMDLVRDLDLGLHPEDLAVVEWDRDVVKDLFDSLEFHTLWNDLEDALPSAVPVSEVLDVETEMVTDSTTVESYIGDRNQIISCLVTSNGEPIGLAISTGEDRAIVVPFDHLGRLIEKLESGVLGLAGYQVKEQVRELLARGYLVARVGTDVGMAAYILNPSQRSYDLEELAERFLGAEISSPDGEETAGMLPFDTGPDLETEGRRVEATRRLVGLLESELETRQELELFANLELPLIPVLARMEQTGIAIDRRYLEDLGDKLRSRLSQLEGEIHSLAGEVFNVNSTDQLRGVLFERLGLPVLKKTSTGKPSTDASVLRKLDHPLVTALLEYRENEKLRSTYVDGYLPLIEEDGRIHTRFNQMGASTGRLSSDRPNLQNIPVRSELGRTIRRAFVAEPGWKFLVADYSQIELRILAHMCGDPFLIDAFKTGADIHSATASRVFGVELEAVSDQQRQRAKMINFGLLYGMEAFGLAERLGIGRDEAKEHIDAYFSQFRDVSEFMASVVVAARNDGYTTTIFGRRRYLPELKSDNFRIRQMGERMALNAPVQGSAADIIKKAMVNLDRTLREEGMDSELLLQIHDELVLECPESEIEKAQTIVVEVMEQVVALDVPLKVDMAVGGDLASVKD